MVHRRARRQGLGRALMLAAEGEARRRGRTTLVLDTRQGDPSEILYRSLGWQLGGTIPTLREERGRHPPHHRLLLQAAGDTFLLPLSPRWGEGRVRG